MKRLFPVILMLAAISVMRAQAPGNVSELADGFSAPPRSAGVYVWWHWMDGNISREGIRKDLLWMDSIGITGLHQFDAGGRATRQIVPEKVHYMSPEWKDAFRYAIALADSLGMEISVASAPGWSNTGGPWVTPEDAMKKLVWTETETDGGKVSVSLPEPPRAVGRYQDLYTEKSVEEWGKDVAVVAVLLSDEEASLAGGVLTCSGGGFTSDQLVNGRFSDIGLLPSDGWLEWSFPSPVTVRSLTVGSERTRRGTHPVPAKVRWHLYADGKYVCGIPESSAMSSTVSIPAVTGRKFRLVDIVGAERQVSEFRLHAGGRVNNVEEKAGFSVTADFGLFPTPEGLAPVREVRDLTSFMSADGRLECTLPAGRWRIYRFGQSLTGKKNHPAAPDATGLEVDKYDRDAWERYFERYIGIYRDAAGGMMGERGIQSILVDSYEAGPQTWTENMFGEFKARRGYDLVRWLPVLAGEIVGSPAESDRFLWDWRAVQGEMIAENYGRVTEFARRHGMKGSYIESHENGYRYVGDGMAVKKNSTVPQSAIWTHNSPSGPRTPMAMADIRESASVAHLWGQNLVAAESFTCNGEGGHAYSDDPANLKYDADIAMSSGLNRFVIHESAHQPSDDAVPGTGLFHYGQWFGRHETWAPMAGAWTAYLSRSCNVLQAGHFVADVLYFYGEDNCITGMFGQAFPPVPEGYAWDFTNADGLLEAVRPGDGKLVSKGGVSYSVLVLGDNCRRLSLKVLKRLEEFAAAGVVICGVIPEGPAGLGDDPAEFAAVKSRIWSQRSVRTSSWPGVVMATGAPDFISSSAGMKFVHRRLQDGTDVYWVRNFSGVGADVQMSFRSPHHKAFVMRPDTGSVEGTEVGESNGRPCVKVSMGADDALFVVLHSSALQPAPAEVVAGETVSVVGGPWRVAFQHGRGAPESSVFQKLESYTENADPGIRYFSGTASYRTEFKLSSKDLAKVRALDLGEVKNMAEIFLNGKSLGIVWKAPYRVSGSDLEGALRKGVNVLEIKVANLWPNRIIGDLQPGAEKITFTPDDFYKADSPLLPSGLLGPVRLVR